MIKILLVDNNDSFVYNLVEIIRPWCHLDVVLEGNLYDGIEKEYQKIILSPGAGLPHDYPNMMQLITRCETTHSILGVCLGCQALASFFGAYLIQLPHPKHGHCSFMKILITNKLMNGLPNNTRIGRYHSWVINPSSLPDIIKVLAVDDNGNIMAIRHAQFPLYGVQFHPESIISEYGKLLLKNFIAETE